MHQLHDQHPLTPQVAVVKSSDPASGTAVNRGDSITYTLTATVSAANLDADLVLEDTLDADLTFGSVTAAGSFTANTAGNPLVFTLPAARHRACTVWNTPPRWQRPPKAAWATTC